MASKTNYDDAFQSEATNLLAMTYTTSMNSDDTQNDYRCDSHLLDHARSWCSVVAGHAWEVYPLFTPLFTCPYPRNTRKVAPPLALYYYYNIITTTSFKTI